MKYSNQDNNISEDVANNPDTKWEQESNLNCIGGYLHCAMCLKETEDKPYQPWIEAGWTKWGIQIWCRIHDVNIMHINFEGSKHIVDDTRQQKPEDLV